MVIFIVPKYTADFKAERAPTIPEISDREVTEVRGTHGSEGLYINVKGPHLNERAPEDSQLSRTNNTANTAKRLKDHVPFTHTLHYTHSINLTLTYRHTRSQGFRSGCLRGFDGTVVHHQYGGPRACPRIRFLEI